MAKEPVTGKPGEPTPASGIYEIIGPRGGDTGEQRTSVQDNPMPPTPKPGQTYLLVEPVKNDAGKAK